MKGINSEKYNLPENIYSEKFFNLNLFIEKYSKELIQNLDKKEQISTILEKKLIDIFQKIKIPNYEVSILKEINKIPNEIKLRFIENKKIIQDEKKNLNLFIQGIKKIAKLINQLNDYQLTLGNLLDLGNFVDFSPNFEETNYLKNQNFEKNFSNYQPTKDNLDIELKKIKDIQIINQKLKKEIIELKATNEKISEELKKKNEGYLKYISRQKEYFRVLIKLCKKVKDKEKIKLNKIIQTLKEKIKDLESQIESKYCVNLSEEVKKAEIEEEEYDLKKMTIGAKKKQKSLDDNIDYPNLQKLKEKLHQLSYYYFFLKENIKKLLNTIPKTSENEEIFNQINSLLCFK